MTSGVAVGFLIARLFGYRFQVYPDIFTPDYDPESETKEGEQP